MDKTEELSYIKDDLIAIQDRLWEMAQHDNTSYNKECYAEAVMVLYRVIGCLNKVRQEKKV